MQGWKRWSALCALLACASAFGTEKQPEPADPSARYERYLLDYVVQADGTYTEVREVEIKLLKEDALENVRSFSTSYSTSTETVQILEAYTRKADGRRIDVPKDNYQKTTNTGEGDGNPAFSDRTTLGLVFPEVAVGDAVVVKYRTAANTPIFDGEFSTVERFGASNYMGEMRITIDAPAAMQPRWKAWTFEQAGDAVKGDRRVTTWTWRNRAPMESERKDWSVYAWGQAPALVYSTFAEHTQIADAYGARALPKAVPNDRIRALAEEIAAGKQGERAIAHALYDWVATNIDYAGNCIGLGAVVPRDTDFVLDNRMGDCKDHATLLQALLAAKGIESKQALVNAGNAYTLPDVPVVSMVNHVINYLPSLYLYVDATSSDTPFGWLPPQDAGKPVLLVGSPSTRAETPPMPAGRNRQVLTTHLKIAADGSVTGKVSVAAEGMYGMMLRSMARTIDEPTRKDLIKTMFGSAGREAKGNIAWPDQKPLLDSHGYEADFEVQEMLPVPGALPVGPMMFAPRPIGAIAAQANAELEPTHETLCTSAYSEERYTIEFAPELKVIALPPSAKVDGEAVHYTSTVSQKGNSVTIHRVLDDRTPGPMCTPAFNAAYSADLKKVLANLKAQLVYGPSAE